ncbi:MAG: class I SAM-dependent methyltransferase [Beijerinckiaceae bacterium]|nr:class I SAM-dependent methyltransferase [Beijerinckiaceae bacterium]
MTKTIALQPRACPACDSERATTRHQQREWRIVACDDCAFVYLPVAAAPDYFTQGPGAWESSLHENHARKLASAPISTKLSLATRFRTKFRKKTPAQYIAAHARGRSDEKLAVLDIGCGSGDYLASLDKRFVPHGIELSKALADRAQSTFGARGGRVVNATAVEALPQFTAGSIDAIVMRSYLEHEPEARKVLEGSHAALRDDGMIVIKVPNYGSLNRVIAGDSWCGFRFPEHVNYFTPGSLAKMAESAGFTCTQGIFDRLPTSDNMWAVLRKA